MRILRALLLVASVAPVFCATACNDFVAKKDYTDLQAKLTDTEAKLKDPENQIADFQAHRYSTFQQFGWRTWRLDSVTGKTCILITTDNDWRNPNTKSDSCACEDFTRNVPNPTDKKNEMLRVASCGS